MNPYDEHQIELRSDEVQEILGTPPGWLIRWGTTAALFTFAVLLAAGWMLRYPDLIKAKIVLTTGNPPVALVARSDGNFVRVMVHDLVMVAKGADLLFGAFFGSLIETDALPEAFNLLVNGRNIRAD
ncbi:MAG: hypothetical protein ACR2K1_15755 [Saprospiraceae bacterium]